MARCPISHHGMTKARGCEHGGVSNFTKMFENNKLAVSNDDATLLGGPGGLMHDRNGESGNSPIPAGYIFFAQFVDHDITLETTSKLTDPPKDKDDVDKLPNFRTPRLDLDCVYGFGPEASPHIYDADRPGRIAVGENGYDLARSPSGVALIGDPRNDENIFVAQMQLMWHRFHNKLYRDRVQIDHGSAGERFEEAQRQTRYHYQWLVLFDFLKRLCDRDVYKQVVPKIFEDKSGFPHFYKGGMPVEFSVAAYRVGHTMVRSQYAVNADNTDVDLFDEERLALGFTAVPEDLVIDWRYLLATDPAVNPRLCKAIDPLFANELQDLPVVGSNNPVERALAFRNLVRGHVMGLPSGQAVAKEIEKESVYGGTVKDNFCPTADGLPKHLSEQTPLLYYILAEAADKDRGNGERLGPVGSAILLEVFGGMLRGCEDTIATKKGDEWKPDPQVSKEKYSLFHEHYHNGFDRDALINEDDYYPFELADVARFVEE